MTLFVGKVVSLYKLLVPGVGAWTSDDGEREGVASRCYDRRRSTRQATARTARIVYQRFTRFQGVDEEAK